MKKRLKAIVFEQRPVIRRVEIHRPQRLIKTFHQQPPPFIPFAEIDRAVHRLHPPLTQPVPGYIQQHIRSFLAVDTVKKTDTTDRNIVSLVPVLLIDKSGDPPDRPVLAILQDPSRHLTMPERLILFRIEYFLYLLIDRTDIGRIGSIELYVYLDEFLCQGRGRNFYQLHKEQK